MPKTPKATQKTAIEPKTSKPQKLTPKQNQFVKEYIIDFNGSRAVRAAFPREKNQRQKAYSLLSKSYMQEAVQKEIDKRSARVERSADEVIERLWEFSDLDKEKYNGGKTVNIKATELLARHYGLFNDKLIVTTSLEDLIKSRDASDAKEES